MTGGKDSYKSRGMVPRSIARVFEETRANPDLTRTIRMSYVEIYNEKIFDLLNPSQDPSAINVVDGPKGSVAIKGLSTPVVMSEEDALELMFEVGWGDIKDELELMVEVGWGECPLSDCPERHTTRLVEEHRWISDGQLKRHSLNPRAGRVQQGDRGAPAEQVVVPLPRRPYALS